MTGGPIYYTERELDDLFRKRGEYAQLVRDIGEEARELAVSQQQVITKIGLIAEQQMKIGQQPHALSNAAVRHAFKLQLEMDAALDEWYMINATRENLRTEYESHKSAMCANFNDILRDPRMRQLYDALSNRYRNPR